MDNLESKLLVAIPQLPDGNFYRSVVLLIHHDDEGAFGVILNRPTNFPLKEVWYAITESNCASNSPIYMGGPVEGPLVALHQDPSIAENQVVEGVYISSEKENLEKLLTGDCESCKVFSGYSGWGPGQLEMEMEAGSWFQTAARKEDIFSTTDNLWEEIAGRIGSQILFNQADGEIEKFDPSLN